ncbi:hypothetical protein RAT170B_1584 [Rickettsia argasii T170-B]|uniref:Uncharacterized protein n=2 Tax=Rickettsia argasii TaxID=1441385 RepID=A0A0F3RCP5_9RICK|nr:hypothetical protein RAT170B_1584 [Rickettsia argasii T170-B]
MLTSPASFIIGVGPGNFLNNVVLVDFFKRDLGTQQIQINNITGFPAGIHTVEQENNIVTLIDPNNFIFSNPLENFVKFLGPSLFPNLVPPFTIEIEQNIHGNKQKFINLIQQYLLEEEQMIQEIAQMLQLKLHLN